MAGGRGAVATVHLTVWGASAVLAAEEDRSAALKKLLFSVLALYSALWAASRLMPLLGLAEGGGFSIPMALAWAGLAVPLLGGDWKPRAAVLLGQWMWLFVGTALLLALPRLYPDSELSLLGPLGLLGLLSPLLRGWKTALPRPRLRIGWLLLFAAVSYYLGHRAYFPRMELRPLYAALSTALVFGGYLLLSLLTGSRRAALWAGSLLYYGWSVLHFCILSWRGTPFLPSDWKHAGAAMTVAGLYRFQMTPELWWYTAILAGLLWCLRFTEDRKLTWRAPARLSLCAGSLLACAAVFWTVDLPAVFGLEYAPISLSSSYKRYGYTLAYAVSLYQTRVRPPEGYNEADLREEAGAYRLEAEVPAVLPNIIVVMDETFADLGDYGTLRVNRDYMPFFHFLSQRDDCASGRVLVSVFGGNTCETEWEFLTGFSREFAPEVSAYTAESFEGSHTLCSSLKGLGYRAMATHPFNRYNFRRNTVYPQMGFDDLLFDESYADFDFLRGSYCTDWTVYEKVLEYLKAEDGPVFSFAVTMQNHGPYSDTPLRDEAEFYIHSEAVDSKPLDQFLSLMYESDRALQELFEAVDALEEPTVALLFGDHFPGLDQSVYDALRPQGAETLAERQLLYATPYAVHANFDMNYGEFEEQMSVNYLGANLLRAIGLPLSPFQNFTLSMREAIPALNLNGYLDNSGTWRPIRQAEGEAAGWLRQYNRLIYNARWGDPIDEWFS